MKSFLIKIGSLLLALVLITGGLYLWEKKYNRRGYFGNITDYDPDNPTGKMVLFRNDPCPNVIIGDSRINEMTSHMDYLEEITGERWFDMGVGGASQLDVNEQFHYCDSVTELKRVILTVSFHRMQVNDHTDHVTIVRKQLDSPLSFIFNRDVLKETWNSMKKAYASSLPEVPDTRSEEERAADLTARLERERASLMRGIYELCTYRDGYIVNTHVIDELRRIAEICEEKGIELIVVAFPFHEDVKAQVIDPLGLMPYIDDYKREISSFATLYDMEFDSDFCRAENFRNYTHFSREPFETSGQKRFLDAIFLGDDTILHRYGPEHPY